MGMATNTKIATKEETSQKSNGKEVITSKQLNVAEQNLKQKEQKLR